MIFISKILPSTSFDIEVAEPIKFTIPGKAISWNIYFAGTHWTQRKKKSDARKWEVKAALLKARIPRKALDKSVGIEFDCYMIRQIDADNIMVKEIIDGIRDWGLLKNDSPKFVKYIKINVYKGKPERIEVCLKI